VTERVHVADYDPAWPGRAVEFAAEVRELFARWLVSEVLHVGSTSVPGLSAKPIIDLQAVAEDPASARRAGEDAAAAAGWMFVPRELDQRAWRWLFVRVGRDGGSRLAHLHLMPPGQQRWRDQLHFRDRLRTSARLRAEYVRIKRRAVSEHPDDREAYGRAKTEFVQRVVAGTEAVTEAGTDAGTDPDPDLAPADGITASYRRGGGAWRR
jgi:GrpB-like predicted nucleotidyltransferase (UPF0157 family)